MNRRGLAVAPLQDPRVAQLLGLSQEELLRAIRFVSPMAVDRLGADAVLAVARELWWARPLLWLARVPGMMSIMHAGYRWVALHRRCHGAALQPGSRFNGPRLASSPWTDLYENHVR